MKKGFTLAEVLITLGIIGIVAAMTIPTLKQNIDRRETVTKVNKAYNTIENALKLAVAKNGSTDKWDVDYSLGYDDANTTKFVNYLKPYLNIVKDCGTENRSQCMYQGTYKKLNGNDHFNYSEKSGVYSLLSSDGTSYSFLLPGYGQASFFFDTNGNKGPNQIGVDLFAVTVGYSNKKDTFEPEEEASSCNKSNVGWGCVKYILLNGNMNYLDN